MNTKRILFLDTETNGLPKNPNSDYTDFENWPELLQLSFHFAQQKGRMLAIESSQNYYFNNPQKKNTNEVSNFSPFFLHNFSDAEFRYSLTLAHYIKNCDLIVCHNINFDINVICANLIKHSKLSNRPSLQYLIAPIIAQDKFCTMTNEAILEYCNVPEHKNRISLANLYNFVFGLPYAHKHNAFYDSLTVFEIYQELLKREVIE